MRLAFITGVSRGLGFALAKSLLALDYQVIGIGRSSHTELDQNIQYQFIACDLSSKNICSDIGRQLEKQANIELQQLILINNAATAAPVGVMGDMSDDEIILSLQLNLTSAIQFANLFCRCFSAVSCDKRIVNISSGAAFTAIPGSGVYCIAKAGLEMLTKSIAVETDHHGVTAMSIQPGVIDTDMQTWLRQQDAKALPSVDMYQGFHDQHQLISAGIVAENIIQSALLAPARNGESFSHDG